MIVWRLFSPLIKKPLKQRQEKVSNYQLAVSIVILSVKGITYYKLHRQKLYCSSANCQLLTTNYKLHRYVKITQGIIQTCF